MTWLSMAAGILACLIAGCGGGSGSGTPAPVAGAPGPIVGAPGASSLRSH